MNPLRGQVVQVLSRSLGLSKASVFWHLLSSSVVMGVDCSRIGDTETDSYAMVDSRVLGLRVWVLPTLSSRDKIK